MPRVRMWASRLRVWVGWLTPAYLLALVVILSLLEWRGGRGWFSSLLLFVPPAGWLLPLVVLTPLCAVLRPKLCWLHLGASVLVFFLFTHWRWNLAVTPDQADLTLLSNNVAQRSLEDLFEFARAERPDVYALQEAHGLLSERWRFPGYYLRNIEEFTLISRFPIARVTSVAAMTFSNRPVAVRFELAFRGQSIAIYNIHMPTPRSYFLGLRGEGLARWPQPGKGIYSKNAWNKYSFYWSRRIELTHILLDQLRNEKSPYLLVGDFNMPDHGYLCSLFNSRFTDVFDAVGRGYGLTFPGESNTALAAYGPWLRIDYQFAGPHWAPLSCRVESRKPAKHLALLGRYRFDGSSPPQTWAELEPQIHDRGIATAKPD